MTIYAPDGITPVTAEPKTDDAFLQAIAAQNAPQPKKYRLVPEPGYVIVGRNEIDPYERLNGEVVRGVNGQPIEKALDKIRIEEQLNIFAIVLSVGEADPNTGHKPDWREGQRIILAPQVFTEVRLDDGDSVWLGSFYGVKAKFVEVES